MERRVREVITSGRALAVGDKATRRRRRWSSCRNGVHGAAAMPNSPIHSPHVRNAPIDIAQVPSARYWNEGDSGGFGAVGATYSSVSRNVRVIVERAASLASACIRPSAFSISPRLFLICSRMRKTSSSRPATSLSSLFNTSSSDFKFFTLAATSTNSSVTSCESV